MYCRVNIETTAWTDIRFVKLAKILGYADARHALINCAVLWSWQTKNYTTTSPTYVVDATTVEACMGRDGAAAALVAAGLAEETPEGFRIRGGVGRIEWLHECVENGAVGGRRSAVKRKGGDKQGSPPSSHPSSDPPREASTPAQAPPQAQAQADGQAQAQATGQASSPLGSSSSHAPERYISARRPRTGGLASQLWNYGAVRHGELKATGIGHCRPWAAQPGSGDTAWGYLLERCDKLLAHHTFEEALAKGRYRVDVAFKKAQRDGTDEYFQPGYMWSAKNFDFALTLDLASFDAPTSAPKRKGARRADDEGWGFIPNHPIDGPRSKGAGF